MNTENSIAQINGTLPALTQNFIENDSSQLNICKVISIAVAILFVGIVSGGIGFIALGSAGAVGSTVAGLLISSASFWIAYKVCQEPTIPIPKDPLIENEAASIIQRAFRSYVTRKKLKDLKESKSSAANVEEKKQAAAATIQCAFRSFLTRKKLSSQMTAAQAEKQQLTIKIQSIFTGKLGPKEFSNLQKEKIAAENEKSAIKIQSFFRDKLASKKFRKLQKKLAAERKQSAIKIQSIFRGKLARKKFRKLQDEKAKSQSEAAQLLALVEEDGKVNAETMSKVQDLLKVEENWETLSEKGKASVKFFEGRFLLQQGDQSKAIKEFVGAMEYGSPGAEQALRDLIGHSKGLEKTLAEAYEKSEKLEEAIQIADTIKGQDNFLYGRLCAKMALKKIGGMDEKHPWLINSPDFLSYNDYVKKAVKALTVVAQDSRNENYKEAFCLIDNLDRNVTVELLNSYHGHLKNILILNDPSQIRTNVIKLAELGNTEALKSLMLAWNYANPRNLLGEGWDYPLEQQDPLLPSFKLGWAELGFEIAKLCAKGCVNGDKFSDKIRDKELAASICKQILDDEHRRVYLSYSLTKTVKALLEYYLRFENPKFEPILINVSFRAMIDKVEKAHPELNPKKGKSYDSLSPIFGSY